MPESSADKAPTKHATPISPYMIKLIEMPKTPKIINRIQIPDHFFPKAVTEIDFILPLRIIHRKSAYHQGKGDLILPEYLQGV